MSVYHIKFFVNLMGNLDLALYPDHILPFIVIGGLLTNFKNHGESKGKTF